MQRNTLEFEEKILHSPYADFTARYVAACNLHHQVRSGSPHVTPATVRNLQTIMLDGRLLRERHSFFLFRETALTFTAIVTKNINDLAEPALATLKRLLGQLAGASHQAATEALGSLPFAIKSLPYSSASETGTTSSDWQQLCESLDQRPTAAPFFAGRSLITPLGEDLLVIKFARSTETGSDIVRESVWMDRLRHPDHHFPVFFQVPQPLSFNGRFLFELEDIPLSPPAGIALHERGLAIAYRAPGGYFSYANDPIQINSADRFREVICRNSRLFGFLAGKGIIHTAPIPLFHNRVQRHRREDNGLYDWPRGGRLDQWLASCRHPNFGLTGIRDFEHFQFMAEPGERFYWQIGAQLLSLFLVAASYFRNLDPSRRGYTADGQPVDARDLFDEETFATLLRSIVTHYYEGFSGLEYTGEIPCDMTRLSGRMIDEMGVDRHMEEIVRIMDQQQMSDDQFKRFLMERGFSERQALARTRGLEEIVLHTGPHLGGFNDRISLPELIEATATLAASCVAGRFEQERLN